jgi:glutamate carboxypeptidase
MLDVLRFCSDHADWVLDLTARLARIESPSHDKSAVDRCGAALEPLLRDLGGRVERLPQASAGDHWRAEFGTGPRRILLLTHLDTVWDHGQTKRMPVEVRDGRLYGPGVYDMKGGVAIGVLAIKALAALGLGPAARVVLLCTSDEEVGSGTSRALIEAEAVQSEAVLVLEPALGAGAVKTSRKGVGVFTVTVDGVSAHAGAAPGSGASAILEMAHQVIALHAMQDAPRGVSLNVGLVAGGTRSNVVPEQATAEVDVRLATREDAGRLERAIRGLTPVDPRTRITVTGAINRPPMERTAGVAALYATARAVAAEMGLDLEEGGTGGASDGNFTAGLGVPTLDGLGAVGDGAHALHEHVLVSSLAERAALLAGLIGRVAGSATAGS